MMKRAAIRILLATALLLTAWWLVLRVTGWRAAFAETDYHTNRIRIESCLLDDSPSVVFAGSSVAGRMKAEYFENTSLPRVANLGLDGSVCSVALEIIARRERPPELVFVETYSLTLQSPKNEKAIAAIADSLFLPKLNRVFRAETRPSALFYSALKSWQDNKGGVPGSKLIARKRTAELSPESKAGLDRSKLAIEALVRRGVRVVIVRIPIGEGKAVPAGEEDVHTETARELGVEFFDLNAQIENPRYSDGLHLVAGSAREACRVLAEKFGTLPR